MSCSSSETDRQERRRGTREGTPVNPQRPPLPFRVPVVFEFLHVDVHALTVYGTQVESDLRLGGLFSLLLSPAVESL